MTKKNDIQKNNDMFPSCGEVCNFLEQPLAAKKVSFCLEKVVRHSTFSFNGAVNDGVKANISRSSNYHLRMYLSYTLLDQYY